MTKSEQGSDLGESLQAELSGSVVRDNTSVAEQIDSSSALFAREKAVWQWKCAAGRIRLEALSNVLAKKSKEVVEVTQAKRDLEVYVHV